MKKHAQIVLGLGFGDEGKGVVTDSLSAKHYPNSVVIRFSGGQQAGHTVMRGGVKHIHSSYGSGTLVGLTTFLSEYTTFFLPSIERERAVLRSKNVKVRTLHAHPLCHMTTPYDVAYNRLRERIYNHGTCGLGVGATMDRNLNSPYKLYAIDLHNVKVLKLKLESIYNYYINKVQQLAKELDKSSFHLINEFQNNCNAYPTEHFLELASMKDALVLVSSYDSISYLGNNFIFEGSQGIMLDMDHGIFPHVTYSNTTSKNALKICKELKAHPEIFYVTRCYQTRHGNGPMTSEEPIQLINNEEEINVLNSYQGSFRVGELDYDLLNYAMDVDFTYSRHLNKTLVVTCLDQRPGFVFDESRISFPLVRIGFNNSPHAGNIKYEHRAI